MTGFELWTICTTITAPMYVVGILVIFYLLNKGQCLCVCLFVCLFSIEIQTVGWIAMKFVHPSDACQILKRQVTSYVGLQTNFKSRYST